MIYIDRKAPVSKLDSFRRSESTRGGGKVRIRSTDGTADSIHVFANLPVDTCEATILADAQSGKGRLDRIDSGLFEGTQRNLLEGDNTLTVVTFELSGTHNIQRMNTEDQ